MKYGALLYLNTDNIGDDIQTYAGLQYLPKVNYVVDRENLDSFLPNNKETVSIIMNSWLLYNKYNWPLSPYLNPFFISVHFTPVDRDYDIGYKHLTGFGLEYLKKYKIGCRDKYTETLLKNLGVNAYLSGCLTLTIDKFKNVKKEGYICAVDVNQKIIDKIKKSTKKKIKVMTHDVNPDINNAISFDKRMTNVETLLKIYQGASLVVTSRLHCALPCLALGTPVLLIYHENTKVRIETFLDYINHCSENDILNNSYQFDFCNPPKNSDLYLNFRNQLKKTCHKFISECQKYKNNIEDLPDINLYKNYAIKQNRFQKNMLIESLDNLKVKVNDQNIIIEELKEKLHKTNEEVYNKNIELQSIYQSKMWKLASIYYKAKRIPKKVYKKSMSLIKPEINNGIFKVINIEVDNNKVQYNYQIEGKIKKYFDLSNKMPIEYSEDISKVPKGILVIPLITDILPIIWINNASLYLDEIDKTFYEAIPNILQGYKKMFPNIKFGGKIRAKKIIDYSYKTSDKVVTLFSGGVDSVHTLFSHIKEKPTLFTIWGSDVDIDNIEAWKIVKKFVQKFGSEFKLNNVFVKSDFRKLINQDELNKDYLDILKDNWWHGAQHGIALLGHTAIYSYMHKLKTVYIPGTLTKSFGSIICASNPNIDNAVRFGNTKVIHDAYDVTRYDKTKFIIDYATKNKIKVNLRVCWRSIKGDNCCECEKCYRTIMSIVSLNQDPNKYGFSIDDSQYDVIRDNIVKLALSDHLHLLKYWKEIQKEFIKNEKKWINDERINWILTYEFDNIKNK